MINRRRVLVTARLYGAGGIETHLLNLCRLLVQNGAQVTLATRYASKTVPLVRTAQDIPLRLIATPFSQNLKWFRFSTAWALVVWPLLLLGRKFDVLYTTEIGWFTRFLSRFLRPNGLIVWSRIGEPIGPAAKTINGVGKRPTGLIVESELHGKLIRHALPSAIPVVAIPCLAHTVDTVKFQPRRIDDCVRLSFLGRYDTNKGVYRLLSVWSDLAVGNARLNFHGDGSERAGLETEIQRRKLGQHIRVNGGWADATELTTILNDTDLVVLPSESEGVPLVLLEAMAHGVPFVATDVGAVRILAEDNPDVLVVANDEMALKQGIEQMVAAIRRGEVQGERLQKYHQRRYGFEKLAEQWIEALLNSENFWMQHLNSMSATNQ